MAWRPRLSPKQDRQYLCPKRIQLAIGARFTGKTWGFEHSVLRHCWRNHGKFAIISKTTRAGEHGIWGELTSTIYDEWVAAGVASDEAEFEWSRKPFVNAVTKVHTAFLRNRFGSESQIVLFPIERADDAREKLLSTQFSGIWISEAQIYDSAELFNIARGQIRLPSVPHEEQRLLLDSNPPKEGKKHWLYEEFYTKRALAEGEFPEDWDDETRLAIQEFQEDSEVFEFLQADNPFADPRKLREFRAMYANNRDDYDRFVLGKWTDSASSLACFKGVFDKNIHVIGNASSPDEKDWEVIFPSNGPTAVRDGGVVQLVGGWDPGEVNHAWAALQPWTNERGEIGFDILDEFFVKKGNEAMPIETLTREVLARRKVLEEMAQFPVVWADYSDSSALRARTQATRADWQAMPGEDSIIDAAVISGVSDGEIRLIGSAAVKNKGWQQRRVNFLAQLLKEGRIRISANCTATIKMFENLHPDPSPTAKTYLDGTQEEKHIFDAVSYPICMMLLDQLMLPSGGPKTGSRMKSV